MMSPVTTPLRRTYLQTVRCPGCGRLRELTDRHVRRGGSKHTLCNLCRFPARRIPPTNSDRRFWLRNYSDDEIALMAEAISDGVASRAEISAWRIKLGVQEP